MVTRSKLLVFAALILFFIWFLLNGIQSLRKLMKQDNRIKKRRSYIRKIRKTLIVMVILPMCMVGVSGVGLVFSISEVLENRTAAPDPPSSSSTSHPADPEPAFPISPPIRNEEDLSLSFRLSAVEGSLMLTLDKQLIGDAEIGIEQLSAADGRLDGYIAQYDRSSSFFPFYPNLADVFPSGESVNYSFDAVDSLEACNAQLRGAGERLERRRANGSLERIGEIFYQLAIRSRDAMNFAKYQTTEGQNDRSIWLYSEISFASLINEYIYTQPEGLTLSNWYYRMAQVYDYLGGIADTKELELRMYFLSTVFLRSAFETLKEQGLAIYPNAYDHEIWTLYMNLLYRVAERVTPAQAEGFYLEIQTVEDAVLQQSLPDKVITKTINTLNNLELYQQWRGRYD